MNPPPPPLPPPIPAQAKPKSGLKVWLAKPWVVVCLALGFSVVALGAYLAYYLFSAKDFNPSASQQACVVTADDLAAQFAFVVNPSGESWTGQRYMDDALEINYEYDDISASMIYINCSLAVDASSSDAKFSLTGYWEGMKLGTKIGEGATVSIEDAHHVFRWGDDSRFAFLKSGGARYAYAFVARRGKKVFFLMVANALMEDPDEIENFLRPFLERFDRESF